MFAVGAMVYFSGNQLTHLFTTNEAALEASLVVLFYSFIGGPATAGTLIFTATWQGLGNAKLPFYATTVGMWVIRIVTGYVLGIVLHFGLTGVWLATVADNVFRWIFLYILYRKYMKKSKTLLLNSVNYDQIFIWSFCVRKLKTVSSKKSKKGSKILAMHC